MNKNVVVLAEAASDIERGMDYYNAIEDGVGLYFRDSIISDLRRLEVYFGEHRIHLGFFRALSSRFPYAIYYRNKEGCRRAGPAAVTGMGPRAARRTIEMLKCETWYHSTESGPTPQNTRNRAVK